MAFEARLFLVCAIFSIIFISAHAFPFGDSRNCHGGAGVYRNELGSGWDKLRNLPMGVVSVMNYSMCKTTDDRKYLIPDNVYLNP